MITMMGDDDPLLILGEYYVYYAEQLCFAWSYIFSGKVDEHGTNKTPV
jgi:hypothetical protein